MTERRKLGVFGGSFDPVHLGHIRAAVLAKAAVGLDEVVFVPAGNQWQKETHTPASHRLAMLQMAVASIQGFSVSTVDVDRGGPTFSFDTITDLVAQYPLTDIYFLVGTDAFAGMDSWHRADELFELANFVVITRPGSQLSVPKVAKGRFRVIEVPALDLSSTEFRKKFGLGLDCSDLVPEPVLTYIRENRLYLGNVGNE